LSRTPLSGSRAENALQGAPGGFQATPGRAAGTLPPMRPIKGTPVAPGLAHGALHVVRARADVVPTWTIRGDEVASERARVEEAVTEAAATLQRRQETVRETVGQQDAGIFAVHRMILEDPSALQRVQRIIDEQRINAEAAVHELIDHLNATMGSLEGDSVRGYGADVSDPWRMVLDLLLRREQASFVAAGESVVLAAAELTPQVVTCLKRERILAVITEAGGRFSHGAVLARSFGIPCVVGLSNLLGRLEQGMTVLVDGDSGSIQLSPSEEEVETFTRRQQRRATRREALFASAHESACTPDGRRLSVCVNLESLYDLETFDVEHCDGVGLLRSEFLYLERSQFPSEEEQFRLYRRVVEHMGERRVVLRTLDIGGDKALPYFKTPAENNPQLGWRGLRILLEWQDLLRVQLRAALRASAYGSIALLLPMVSSLEEVLAVRKIIRGVRKSLAEQGYEVGVVPLGIMIEVPSTIWVLEELIREVDFVSVGTNDLTQYLLAIDRDNPFVAKLYEPYHPAVLRALSQVAKVARAAGKSCSVCGEVAGDSAVVPLLVGMGYDTLSVAPNFLPEVRATVRCLDSEELEGLVGRAIAAPDTGTVRELLEEISSRLHERIMGSSDED